MRRGRCRIYGTEDDAWFNVRCSWRWVRFRLMTTPPWGYVSFPSVSDGERVMLRRSEIRAVVGSRG